MKLSKQTSATLSRLRKEYWLAESVAQKVKNFHFYLGFLNGLESAGVINDIELLVLSESLFYGEQAEELEAHYGYHA